MTVSAGTVFRNHGINKDAVVNIPNQKIYKATEGNSVRESVNPPPIGQKQVFEYKVEFDHQFSAIVALIFD